MLLECQESCIINGGNTKKHFKLQKSARQGDLVSAYLFILCAFSLHKRHYFLLRDKRSIKKLINTFTTFSKYSGLKPNHEK